MASQLLACVAIDIAANTATFIQLGIGATAPPPPPPPPPPPTATVPAVIQSLTLTPGDGSMLVAWTPPLSDGGSAITGYVVTFTPTPSGGQPPLVAATDRTVVVSGLTNGTLYTVTAAARNVVGVGQSLTQQATPTSTSQIPSQWPDASNTGVPAGTVLTNRSTRAVSTNGALYEDLHFTSGAEITGSNNTFRRCRFTASGGNNVYIRSGTGTVLEDCEIIGGENGIAFGNYVLRRCEVRGQTKDGAKASSNTTIEDSYFHDMKPSSEAHADCIQMESGSSNLYILRNSLDCRTETGTNGGNPNGNSSIILKPDFSSGSGPLLVDGNLLAGGNYTFYFVSGSPSLGGHTQTGATIRNNTWRNPPPRGTATYGPVSRNMPCVWENNRFENGTAV